MALPFQGGSLPCNATEKSPKAHHLLGRPQHSKQGADQGQPTAEPSRRKASNGIKEREKLLNPSFTDALRYLG